MVFLTVVNLERIGQSLPWRGKRVTGHFLGQWNWEFWNGRFLGLGQSEVWKYTCDLWEVGADQWQSFHRVPVGKVILSQGRRSYLKNSRPFFPGNRVEASMICLREISPSGRMHAPWDVCGMFLQSGVWYDHYTVSRHKKWPIIWTSTMKTWEQILPRLELLSMYRQLTVIT